MPAQSKEEGVTRMTDKISIIGSPTGVVTHTGLTRRAPVGQLQGSNTQMEMVLAYVLCAAWIQWGERLPSSDDDLRRSKQ